MVYNIAYEQVIIVLVTTITDSVWLVQHTPMFWSTGCDLRTSDKSLGVLFDWFKIQT